MLTMIPWLLASAVLIALQADGALSRRQPGAAKHGLGPMLGSTNWSYLTDVSSMPQLPAPPWCFIAKPGAGVTSRLKEPAQPTPFMFQNCLAAIAVVPGAVALSSSGGLSSFESRLPLESDL